MAVIYSDIEATLVAYLKTAMPDVYIATKKAAPDHAQPEKQIVITVAWAGDKEQVLKYAGVVLDVYADNDIACTNLALLAEAHLRSATVGAIKKVEILAGPIRQAEDSAQEKRSISAEVTVQATSI